MTVRETNISLSKQLSKPDSLITGLLPERALLLGMYKGNTENPFMQGNYQDASRGGGPWKEYLTDGPSLTRWELPLPQPKFCGHHCRLLARMSMTKEGIKRLITDFFALVHKPLTVWVSTGLSNIVGFLLETSALKEPRR